MITEGSIVRGTLDSGDPDFIMGTFMVLGTDEDGLTLVRCISHEGDPDFISEDFYVDLDEFELVSESTGVVMAPNPMKMMSSDVPSMSTEDMMVLGLI